ncbi:MAG: SDR family oxidoreductase [Bacteroidota bacterium]
MSNEKRPPAIAISGASAGIGLAIAEHFARQGWWVSIAARSEEDLTALRERWQEEFPNSLLRTVALDLSEPGAAKAWAAYLADFFFGKLDVLVHNLGQFAPGTLLGGGDNQLAHFFATNIMSAHRLTRAMLPLLLESDAAQMITIGSVSTTDWPADLAAYTLSKYAQEGWHRQISKELKVHHIRTTLIRPGATYTRSWDGIDVDPTTLLQAETVAAVVGQAVFSSSEAHLEELSIRPA